MKPKNQTQPPDSKGKARRGPGQTQTTISISEDALEKARTAAAADRRSLSNFLELLILKNAASEKPGS